jgi:hypothetical protein
VHGKHEEYRIGDDIGDGVSEEVRFDIDACSGDDDVEIFRDWLALEGIGYDLAED